MPITADSKAPQLSKSRYKLRNAFAITILALSALVALSPAAQADENATDWKANEEARTRLLTPFGLEADGRTVWIGLEMDLEPGWHSYWKNPGDAGLPPTFPEFDTTYFSKIEVNFPPPKFYPFGGGLDANGYAHGVVYPVKLTLTDKARSQKKIPLKLGMFYLVCKDLCIPHDESFNSELLLNRDGSATAKTPFADKMRKALALLPKSPQEVPEANLRESLTPRGDDYLLTIAFRSPVVAEEFPSIFFLQTPTLKLGKPDFNIGKDKRDIIITVVTTPVQTKVADVKLDTVTIGYLLTHIPTENGVISIEKEAHLKVGDTPVGAAMTGAAGATDAGGYTEAPSTGVEISLWKMLFFAFLGGLILNIMPCVLPVLSIKLMGIMAHSGESRTVVSRGMVLSSAGIITSFLLLGAAAVIAKSAGAAIGWGVQFQEPIFVSFLAIIVFLFGLNLWGVFEVTLPASVSTGAVKASQRGHFTQGMLATLLATPCSAPFLGSAVGFAFASPAPVVFAIFFALGLGMATPYLTLAIFPKAIRFLPKPGPWMEKAKGFFGFLLMATVVWLMFVLAGQIDPLSQALVWLGLLLLAMVIWGKRAFAPYSGFFSSVGGLITIVLTVAISALTMHWAITGRVSGQAKATPSDTLVQWSPYSDAAVNEHLTAGKVVFVDVTADWCWTCKLNEKLFIETDEVSSLLNDQNVVALRADWTNRNQEIGDFLAHYGRSGIPFYIAFYGGDPNNFIALPVTITQGTLVDALQTAIEKNRAFSNL